MNLLYVPKLLFSSCGTASSREFGIVAAIVGPLWLATHILGFLGIALILDGCSKCLGNAEVGRWNLGMGIAVVTSLLLVCDVLFWAPFIFVLAKRRRAKGGSRQALFPAILCYGLAKIGFGGCAFRIAWECGSGCDPAPEFTKYLSICDFMALVFMLLYILFIMAAMPWSIKVYSVQVQRD